MNYDFIVPFPQEEYRAFVDALPHCNFMQKDSWMKVKTTWQGHLCGLRREGETVAVALLLTRRLPTGQKLIYAPRGFLLDYSDRELISVFTREICTYAKKNGCLYGTY